MSPQFLQNPAELPINSTGVYISTSWRVKSGKGLWLPRHGKCKFTPTELPARLSGDVFFAKKCLGL